MASHGGARGGRRPSPAEAIFTEQVVVQVTPAIRERIDTMTTTHGVSMAKIVRAIVWAGIDDIEKRLGDGTLSAGQLA